MPKGRWTLRQLNCIIFRTFIYQRNGVANVFERLRHFSYSELAPSLISGLMNISVARRPIANKVERSLASKIHMFGNGCILLNTGTIVAYSRSSLHLAHAINLFSTQLSGPDPGFVNLQSAMLP